MKFIRDNVATWLKDSELYRKVKDDNSEFEIPEGSYAFSDDVKNENDFIVVE